VLIEILPIWTAKEKEFTGLEMGDINENLLREVDAGEEVIDSDDKVSLKDKVWIEMKKMWIVAGPAMFTRLSTFGLNVITQAFVGHIGSTELAAYSYVYTVIVRLANGVLVCLIIKWFSFSLIIIYIYIYIYIC
jgi:hypothetical protein